MALLFGRDAIAAFGSASVVAQLLLLFGTSFYAVATITARYGRDIPPLIFASGYVSIAAVVSWIIGIVGLGIAPTAAASILYMLLSARSSATFLSLTGYTIPVISIIVGYIAFGEVRHWSAFAAFALILSGVWLAQRGGKADDAVKAETRPQSP